MLKQKKDILSELKKAGFSSYWFLKKQPGLISQKEIQKLRTGGIPSLGSINKICALLGCQPGDLIEFVPEADDLPELSAAAPNAAESAAAEE